MYWIGLDWIGLDWIWDLQGEIGELRVDSEMGRRCWE